MKNSMPILQHGTDFIFLQETPIKFTAVIKEFCGKKEQQRRKQNCCNSNRSSTEHVSFWRLPKVESVVQQFKGFPLAALNSERKTFSSQLKRFYLIVLCLEKRFHEPSKCSQNEIPEMLFSCETNFRDSHMCWENVHNLIKPTISG